jgi:hypothetical protein
MNGEIHETGHAREHGVHNRGFSIVELLVAAAITGIIIIAVVAMARKGGELETTAIHRRAARRIITSYFESMEYDASNYGTLTSTVVGGVCLDTGVDTENEDDDFSGELDITVIDTLIEGMPAKRVTMTIEWEEAGGAEESVSVSKLISGAK